ncbi:MAG: MarR family transcriptional regulator [Acidobacteriota bacterium]
MTPDPSDAEAPTAIADVRESFVQLWGALGPFWGITPTAARVHAWLLSHPDPADSEAIMDGLEMSRGAVSMACRELREWHLVEAEKSPGSRRAHYRPATDLEKVVRNIVRIRKHREWDPIVENLQEWIPRLDAEPSPEADVFRRRLESLESLAAMVDSMMEMFLKGGLLSRVGLKLLVDASRPDRHAPAASTADAEPELAGVRGAAEESS